MLNIDFDFRTGNNEDDRWQWGDNRFLRFQSRPHTMLYFSRNLTHCYISAETSHDTILRLFTRYYISAETSHDAAVVVVAVIATAAAVACLPMTRWWCCDADVNVNVIMLAVAMKNTIWVLMRQYLIDLEVSTYLLGLFQGFVVQLQ